MEEKKYTIEDVIAEASEFLNRKKKRNEITYKNYRTTLKYFIYYLNNGYIEIPIFVQFG